MPNHTSYIDLELLGIGLRLTSEQKDLLDFIKLITGLSTVENVDSDPSIYVNFGFNKLIQIPTQYNKISRNICLGDSSILITEIPHFPGLSLKVKIRDSKLYIDAYFSEKRVSFIKNLLSNSLNLQKHKSYKSLAFTYHLVYFPLLYYIERFSNLFLLHASAFEYDQYAIILSGLGGIGKSTFSLAALFLEGSKLLSDNLLFHDAQNIYSFPEPIALDRNSYAMLGEIKEILIPCEIASTHDRIYYHITPENRSHRATPKYLFWLQSGSENRLIPIETQECINHLLNINLLANELRQYYVLAATFDLAFPKLLSPNSYSKSLSCLLKNIDCYILQFKPGDDIRDIFSDSGVNVIL